VSDEWERQAEAAGYHSRPFIQMFLGYLAAQLPMSWAPRLRRKDLLDLFDKFEKQVAEEREPPR
jgi:hypothetical protein